MCALGTAEFDLDGYALYKNKDSPAMIYGDESIVGNGISVHRDIYPNPDLVEACCEVKAIDLSVKEDKKKLR